MADLIYWRDAPFTRFLPVSTAGEDAWRVIAAQTDGTGAVLTIQEPTTIASLRRAGYSVRKRAAADMAVDMSDDDLLAALT